MNMNMLVASIGSTITGVVYDIFGLYIVIIILVIVLIVIIGTIISCYIRKPICSYSSSLPILMKLKIDVEKTFFTYIMEKKV